MRPVAPWAWSLACEPLPIRSGGTLKGEDRWVRALLFGLRLSVVRVSRSFANARAADPCAQAQAPRRNRQNARQIDLSEAGRGEPAAGVITAQRQWPAALEAGERSAWTVFPRRPPLVLINLHDRAIRCDFCAMVFGNLRHYSFIVSTVRPQLARGVCMKEQRRRLNSACLARLRQHVPSLGDEFLSAAPAHEADECEVWRESSRDPWEWEDEGRRLTCLRADGNRVARAFACLARLDRAPERIQEGTYGFSDVNGRQILQERLEMVPDAICTLDEEQTFECAGDPGRLQ